MSGKNITVHSDGAQSVRIVYDPEVTEEIALECLWIHDLAILYMNEDELEALAKNIKRAVKKVRKLKAQQLP